MRKKANDDRITIGSGNVFADLCLPQPEEDLLKADLMHVLMGEIRRRGLTQEQAAAAMHLRQAEVSRIRNGRSMGFSIERLIEAGRHLGLGFEINVSHTDEAFGPLSVRELESA